MRKHSGLNERLSPPYELIAVISAPRKCVCRLIAVLCAYIIEEHRKTTGNLSSDGKYIRSVLFVSANLIRKSISKIDLAIKFFFILTRHDLRKLANSSIASEARHAAIFARLSFN